MVMELVIFPGGGNPAHPSYRGVYDLLQAEAISRGYESVDAATRWPGHYMEDEPHEAGFTLDGAVEVAAEVLCSHEEKGSYDLLGRSLGSLVAVQCTVSMGLTNLRRVVLWGPSPYWIFWEMWRRDLDKTQEEGHKKGLHTDESLFPSMTPFEVIFPQLRKPTIVATGKDDNISSPAFLRYLESLVAERSNFLFRIVDGAPHAVGERQPEEVKRRYAEALFEAGLGAD